MFDSKPSQPVTAQAYGSNLQQSQQSIYESKKQPKSCRDPMFAVLFYVNLAAIAAVVVRYGSNVFTLNEAEDNNADANDDAEHPDIIGFLYASLAAGAIAAGLSALMLVIMMAIPGILIKVALVFNVVVSGLVVLYAGASGNYAYAIVGGIFFALFCCYACMVWSRIPFATANLVTGTTAIRSNCGVTLIGYIMVAGAFAWSALWISAFLGVQDQIMECETDADGIRVCSKPNYLILFFMLLSYFFTHQVLKNTVHVTVAGVVGTWWFAPDDNSCCGATIFGSLFRALTSSFGSICFGSLIVAILQAIRSLIDAAKQNDDIGSALACCLDCLIGCIEGLVEYFNKWAFIYVGIYGYGYIEAGKGVMALFKDRGWEAIIADDLVGMVLGMLSLVVGLVTGALCLIFESQTDWFDEFKDDADPESETFVKTVLFILGLIVGLVMCSILMSSIDSAVLAVIVLFAECPGEFDENYPELSRQMRDAYAIAYPDYQ